MVMRTQQQLLVGDCSEMYFQKITHWCSYFACSNKYKKYICVKGKQQHQGKKDKTKKLTEVEDSFYQTDTIRYIYLCNISQFFMFMRKFSYMIACRNMITSVKMKSLIMHNCLEPFAS